MPAPSLALSRPDPISRLRYWMAGLVLSILTLWALPGQAVQIKDFDGTYSGRAKVEDAAGEMSVRDLTVEIASRGDSFTLTWTTVSYRLDGRVKESSYTIDFVPSERDSVFAAAMGKNVFGHSVQLDPMKGDPYVWGHLDGATLTVYSMFIGDHGGYEIQEYRRTLVEGGLELELKRFRNGTQLKTVEAFLARQN